MKAAGAQVRTWLDGAVTALMLGTAQWGHGYGVTNTVGRLSDAAIADIVAVAREWGIDSVDTALGYGDAQARLGPFAHEFAVTTKVAAGEDVAEQAREALEDLGLNQVHAVLAHDWDALDRAEQRRGALALVQLAERGDARLVGASVYDSPGVASAAEAFASAAVPLGMLQVPASVLDRRLDADPALAELAHGGTQIVVRSAFLQGVLLDSRASRAAHPDVARLHREAAAAGVSPLALCLSHVKALPWASHVVVGVTSPEELNDIAATWASVDPHLADPSLASADLDLIDPRRW